MEVGPDRAGPGRAGFGDPGSAVDSLSAHYATFSCCVPAAAAAITAGVDRSRTGPALDPDLL